MKKSAIIVAGGKGLRMGSEIPKQFLELNGKPIIVHTIQRFLDYDPELELVVVLPASHVELWSNLKNQFFPEANIQTAIGGDTRFESVKSGLKNISDGLVAIHDAVRPFVTPAIISKSFDAAEMHGSGVVAVPLKDSVREVQGEISMARNRDDFKLVQTPQTFRVEQIKEAYQQPYSKSFTDDATVFELAGNLVHLVEGSYANIKITTQDDLK